MKIPMMMVLLLSAHTAFAGGGSGGGGTVEKGGRAIVCLPEGVEPSPIGTPIPEDPSMIAYNAKFESVDYVRALAEGYQASDFTAYQSWAEGRDRMLRLLSKVSPALYSSFKEFSEAADRIGQQQPHRGPHLRRAWIPARGTLETGQLSIWKVPPRCVLPNRIQTGGAVVNMGMSIYFHTVTRRQDWLNVEYLYDPHYLDNLRENGFLHYTFLLTHEWLWDHTDVMEVNQDVNAFLHSNQVDHMTPEEIRQFLLDRGLKF